MASGDNRFQDKPVDGLVRIIQRSQIDLPVPTIEQFVIRGKLRCQIIREKNTGFSCSFGKSSAKIARCHAMRVAETAASASVALYAFRG